MGNGKKLQYHYLKEKWVNRHRDLSELLWAKHKDSLQWLSNKSKHVATGSLASLMLLASPVVSPHPTQSLSIENNILDEIGANSKLALTLLGKVPMEVRPLTGVEEIDVTKTLSDSFGFTVMAQIDGKRLQRNYGYIGLEQHLMRYPGDTMDSHFATDEEAKKYWSSGMAPGRGAWGYFAPSQSQMSEKDVLREKYYIAVPTFLAPRFNYHVKDYSDFFRYRKMLVVNPQNGKAMVVVVGDAGPATWTGKHLGGSPEVMGYLERVDGRQKGPVLYFFIDDPDDTIPLGPINIRE